jgi:hypothetical protein
MPRSVFHRSARPVARAALAIACTLPILGCASSSRTALGLDGGIILIEGPGIGDTLGAAMFEEHIRLAAAESRRQRLLRDEYAAVNVQVD